MYLCFAWPSLFASKIGTWLHLRDLIYPKMDTESSKFEEIVAELIQEVKANPSESAFYTAVQAVKDPHTGQPYPGTEIWRELRMLTRAGMD